MSFVGKVRFLHAILIIVLSIVAASADTNETLEFYPEERNALMQIRDIVSSSSNLHANWTGPPCYYNQSNWAGIACSNSHITRIVLENIQLKANSLPPTFLENITYLTKLSFRNNTIFGPLPSLTNLLHLQFVFFSHNRFSGQIPFEYINLPKLTKLEVQDNSLEGSIPPFNQSTLTTFNVSYNHLEGLIPETRVLQSFPKSSFDHNSDLCGKPLGIPCPVPPPPPPPPPPPIPSSPPKEENKRTLQVWSIVLIAAAAAIVPLSVMLVFICYYRRVHGKEENTDQPTVEGYAGGAKRKTQWSKSTSSQDPERTVELEFFNKNRAVTFDLDDLLRASAEVLGKGKLGTTYKAMLESNSVVAVKRLKDMNALSKKEFVQQMQLLGKMRHDNLVDIISFYYSKDEKLIVYEFVPHGNLFDLLHENRGAARVTLNWSARMSIIKDIAKGLSFLHQVLPSQRVPHANLKSSNVLIELIDNQNYHSKLTDFGFLPLLQTQKSSQKLAIGNSPEFSQGKKLTNKADVYCFGIIILEIITGKVPGKTLSGDYGAVDVDDLSDWVWTVVNTDWSTEILDSEILAATEGHDEMLRLTQIALQCTDMAPESRPKMSEVLRRIEEIEKTNSENE